jgi:hypothetical protein
MIYFQDNDLANENKHDCGFKITTIIDVMNGAFRQL